MLAAWLLCTIASGNGRMPSPAGSLSNGFADHSPGGYSHGGGVHHRSAHDVLLPDRSSSAPPIRARPAGFAPLAIGLALTLIHLISIPITNTSVNPARSTGPAIIVGGWALQQLWLFWIAPIIGAVAAGGFWRWLK